MTDHFRPFAHVTADKAETYRAVLGAFVAAKYLDEVIRAYKRPSILVWILAFLLMVSAVTIPIIGRIRVMQEANPFSFSSPC